MDLGTPVTLTKLDAARRQLTTAVDLYFHEADAVSIHTLAAAAHQLLSDVNDARGGTPTWRKQLLGVIKPEHRDFVQNKLREAQNFFKHADKDPEAHLTFDGRRSEILIQDACLKYHDLTGEVVTDFVVFRAWFAIQYREVLDPAKQAGLPPIPDFALSGPAAFFKEAFPLIHASLNG